MKLHLSAVVLVFTFVSVSRGRLVTDNSKNKSKPSEPPNSEKNLNREYIKKAEAQGETTLLCSICKRRSDCVTKRCYKGYCVNKRSEVRDCQQNDLRTIKAQDLPSEYQPVYEDYPAPHQPSGPRPVATEPYIPPGLVDTEYQKPYDPSGLPPPEAVPPPPPSSYPYDRSQGPSNGKKGCTCTCGKGKAFNRDRLKRLRDISFGLNNKRKRRKQLRRKQFFELHKNILASCNRCRSSIECPKRFERCISSRCAFDGSTRLACPVVIARQMTGPAPTECVKCDLDSECDSVQCLNGYCATEGCTLDTTAPEDDGEILDDDLDEPEDFSDEYGDFEGLDETERQDLTDGSNLESPYADEDESIDDYLSSEDGESLETTMEPVIEDQ